MTANNFEFKQTISALNELKEALSLLENAVKEKKRDCTKKDKKISGLTSSTKEAIGTIDKIVNKLNKVIE
ncbi:MAG: hypothetical protein LBR70_05630 [Lactobacillaceae bacterium]|jgi:soluble cytochrome b562|nr:hypothetical protein [Lactobacillaceae bacterium]